MSCEIVIARYNENLDWVNKLDPSIKVTIYNKGLNDINFPFITLPNVGRETHTYLYHIIHNYKSLADQTIFCQGNTISHSPDFLKLLKVREQFEPIQSLSAYYSHGAQNIPSTEMKKLTTHLHINNLKVHVEYVDNDFITQYPMYEYDSGNIQNMKKFMKSVNTDNILKYTIKRLKLINVNDKDLFPFSYAAIFSVNKNVILNNSKQYYENIMDFHMNDKRIDNQDFGYIVERLWLVIFNYKKYNSTYEHVKVKDYLLTNIELSIKKNIIKIHMTNIFRLYFGILFDSPNFNNLYHVVISSTICYIKHKKKGVIFYTTLKNNKIFNSDLIIVISLKNNKFIVNVNNVNIIEKIMKKNKILDITLFDIAKNNNMQIL